MFQIECKLFFRSKKVLVALLLFCIFVLASSILRGYRNHQAKQKVLTYYEQTIQNFENTLQELDQAYQNHDLSEDDYKAEQAFYGSYIKSLQEELQAAQEDNWPYFYQKNLHHYQLDNQYISFAYESYEFHPQTIENTVKVSSYLLEHALPTAFPTELFLTAFEAPTTAADREIVHNLGQQALKGTSHEIWQWQKQIGTLVSLPLFLLCFTEFFIRDQLGNRRQLRLLRSLGLNQRTLVRNKYLAFLCLYSLTFLGCYLLLFMASLFINGPASWTYPLPSYQASQNSLSQVDIILKPLYQVTILASLVHYLYLLLVLGLAQIGAKVFKNGLAASVFTLGLIACANYFPNLANPLSLWNSGQLADGSAMVYHQWYHFSINKPISLLLLSTLIIHALHIGLLTRQKEVHV